MERVKRIVMGEARKLGVRVEKIILFGSRARGEEGEESDYDILVIVREGIGRRERWELADSIRWRLANMMIPSDVIVVPLDKWRRHQDTPGHLLYSVKREGRVIG